MTVPFPRASRCLPAVVLCLTALASAPAIAQATPTPGAAACVAAEQVQSPARTVRSIRCLLTVERAARGLPRLTPDVKLRNAARVQARGIVRTGVFGHVVPGVAAFPGRLRAANFRFRSAGENLAWEQGSRATAAQVVRDWMDSPPHRAAVLDPGYQRVGVSVVPRTPGGDTGLTAAAVFGTTL